MNQVPPGELWVIDPSVHRPEDEGVREIVQDWGGAWRLFRPVLSPGDGPGPETGYGTAGVVLMGAAASVHEEHGWLEPLSRWLRPILDGSRPLPLFGICFGHQLIGHLAGGEVAFLDADRGKRVGVEASRLGPGGLLEAPAILPVVVSHREHLLRPAPGYRTTAEREGVPVDGMRHETLPIHSVQFHPEARGEFAAHSGIDPACIDDHLRDGNRKLLAAFRELAATFATHGRSTIRQT